MDEQVWKLEVIERLTRIEERLPCCEKDVVKTRLARVETKSATQWRLILILLTGVVTLAFTNAKDILTKLF